jgi:hypothetical protein
VIEPGTVPRRLCARLLFFLVEPRFARLLRVRVGAEPPTRTRS